MNRECIKALDLAKELGVYLRLTVSTKEFDNYNSFFNIYGESDEPCRRIAVLTKYKDLEEVSDEHPDKPLDSLVMLDGNVWIKEYPLTQNPIKIDKNEILVSPEDAETIRNYFKERA